MYIWQQHVLAHFAIPNMVLEDQINVLIIYVVDAILVVSTSRKHCSNELSTKHGSHAHKILEFEFILLNIYELMFYCVEDKINRRINKNELIDKLDTRIGSPLSIKYFSTIYFNRFSFSFPDSMEIDFSLISINTFTKAMTIELDILNNNTFVRMNVECSVHLFTSVLVTDGLNSCKYTLIWSVCCVYTNQMWQIEIAPRRVCSYCLSWSMWVTTWPVPFQRYFSQTRTL